MQSFEEFPFKMKEELSVRTNERTGQNNISHPEGET